MPLVEWAAPTPALGPAVGRGALWALIISLGMLSKLTFAALVIILAPSALVASGKRSGVAWTAIKFAAMVVGLVPLFLVLVRYGGIYYAHALGSAFGPESLFYDGGLTRLAFLQRMAPQVGPMLAVAAALAAWAIFRRADRGRLLVASWSVATLLFYLFIAAGSPNKDARFFWLVWLALPFCVAAAIAPRLPAPAALPHRSIATALVAVALALPMFNRFDLESLRVALETLGHLPADRQVTALLATDEPSFNIEFDASGAATEMANLQQGRSWNVGLRHNL